ncbi:uncharacterized protein LOC125711409 isoform X1 [Brienomyrus brachyistius]|uniref:uncharacterized protein LOC125711409 isoform X1 n=2 Tax=Brienomyrus brachyistius TaxID=42636 RepID=UPI0020B2B06F|nr:uncharacterized protein LOC125711409 isoform X1 [Brienomyrus brachyistius]
MAVTLLKALDTSHTCNVIGMSSVQGVARAVGGWRAHMLLSESDGDASPEAPDRFKKLRSGSSLNSLRMSLRKRLPLKPVRSNPNEKRSWEPAQDSRKPSAVRLLTRSACNSFGSVCQKLQKKRVGRGERLVVTPSKSPSGLQNGCVVSPSTVTPKRVIQRTPKSATKKVPRLVRTAGQQDRGSMFSRRQLVRVVARSSPFVSLEAQNHSRRFKQDMDSLSTDLRNLDGLSPAFDRTDEEDGATGLRGFR